MNYTAAVSGPTGDGAQSSSQPGDIDLYLGQRIRECRKRRGLSQQQLGEMVGITYQQTHKYERGLSRIPAGRLHAFARALQMPLSWFFEGLDEAPVPAAQDREQKALQEFSRSLAAIDSEEVRDALGNLARLLADGERRRAKG